MYESLCTDLLYRCLVEHPTAIFVQRLFGNSTLMYMKRVSLLEQLGLDGFAVSWDGRR